MFLVFMFLMETLMEASLGIATYLLDEGRFGFPGSPGRNMPCNDIISPEALLYVVFSMDKLLIL